MAMATVRWKRLKSPERVAQEREAYRDAGLPPDRVSPRKPPFYVRVVTPEHQGVSRVYRFERKNNHTVAMPERDAQILLFGDDGADFEEVFESEE